MFAGLPLALLLLPDTEPARLVMAEGFYLMEQPIILGQEELLFLIGLQKLPPPLFPDLLAGYTADTVGIALAAAMNSLVARDLLQLQADSPPTPSPQLAATLAHLGLERCLMLMRHAPDQQPLQQWNIGPDSALLYTTPRPGTHSLQLVPLSAALSENLLEYIAHNEFADSALDLCLPTELVLSIHGYAQSGQLYALLLATGVEDTIAAQACQRLGINPHCYLLSALPSPSYQAQLSLVLIVGEALVWLANISPDAASCSLYSIDRESAIAQFHDFLARA